MRLRIAELRTELADALRLKLNSDRCDYLAQQKGMFSLLNLKDGGAKTLSSEHGVYMPASGRVNMAGLRTTMIDTAATRIARVLSD